MHPGEGRIDFALTLQDGLFNRVLGEECGTEIRGDAHLLALMKELVAAKAEYEPCGRRLYVQYAKQDMVWLRPP